MKSIDLLHFLWRELFRETREDKKKENIKDMSEIVNQLTNVRIRQRVYKVKTNKEIDEELLKWKREKIEILK